MVLSKEDPIMPERKPNRRVQYTRRALREALIDLVCEKPLSSISITDICARADINRSTFYLHYQGIHDLLGEIEAHIIEQMEQQLTCTPTIETLHSLVDFLERMRQSPRNVKLFSALCGEQGDPHFVRRLQEMAYEAFQRGWNNTMPGTAEGRKRLIYSYIVSGIIAVLSAWMQGELDDLRAQDVIHTLEAIVRDGIRGVKNLIA